jgi:hypothetical protein
VNHQRNSRKTGNNWQGVTKNSKVKYQKSEDHLRKRNRRIKIIESKI